MIFCTWASDDFNCDLYVRKDGPEFFVHVAHARYVGEAPRSIVASTIPRRRGPERTAALDAYCRRCRELMDWMIATPTMPLGGDHAGEVFVERHWDGCIECVRYLRDRGYRVPDAVLAELRYRRDLERHLAMEEARAA